MKKLLPIFALCLVSSAQAETLWSDFSLTYLNGSHYQVGDNERQVGTFEYVTGTTWGGAFLFVDRLESSNGDTETYGEFSPKFSLHKFKWEEQDISLAAAGTIEFGEGFTHYLYGLSIGTKPRFFNFLNAAFYRRNNDSGKDNWQMTLTWATPFELGETKWMFDGFLDWASAIPEQNQSATMNWTSQVKWDLAPYMGLKAPLYIGFEYAYWNSKFGIEGVDERNASFLLKWHF
ncbi:nucleoside-binding protein [Aliiglaciecola sp. CAU 1673]|uniref:nucleoside-binding protein n=1 Tax=Aliiglaciecola sp. CAU 1673 TaxID=3032595 RepID=UPI0023DB3845|nr:nucleoside-binding protein [Aliiglaciecola sp. CAU 1673]MDF2176960.1 nucleoside-binding protein [Aliiglaciecola sp. CAU 1673]